MLTAMHISTHRKQKKCVRLRPLANVMVILALHKSLMILILNLLSPSLQWYTNRHVRRITRGWTVRVAAASVAGTGLAAGMSSLVTLGCQLSSMFVVIVVVDALVVVGTCRCCCCCCCGCCCGMSTSSKPSRRCSSDDIVTMMMRSMMMMISEHSQQTIALPTAVVRNGMSVIWSTLYYYYYYYHFTAIIQDNLR